jgi:halorhodopsin
MAMISTTVATATLAQYPVPLQVEASQRDVFERIADSLLISSSLWVNITLAGLSIVLFAYMGRHVEDSRTKLIIVSTMMVTVVSMASYIGVVSGLTASILEMPLDTR